MALILGPGETRELNVAMEPIPVPPATLYGRVIDAVTSLGIGGVLVEVVGAASTTTASDGTYIIQNIPPGTYTVRFSHPDYETVEY